MLIAPPRGMTVGLYSKAIFEGIHTLWTGVRVTEFQIVGDRHVAVLKY